MKIAIIEPYAVSSHLRWANEWAANSIHQFRVFSLPARHWKWRMHGAAITLSQDLMKSGFIPDLLICTDMMDLALFKSLLAKKFKNIPIAFYFHENQFAYPFSEIDSDRIHKRDEHYAFLNFSSALVADKVFFNSDYNKNSFLSALPSFLSRFPDFQNLDSIEIIQHKSDILYPGIDRAYFEGNQWRVTNKVPIILWNHRWEYDKNPQTFFEVLYKASLQGCEFKLIVAGENFENYPIVFDEYKIKLAQHIEHWGYVENRSEYLSLLQKSDLTVITSNQEFFGYSVLEAIAAGVSPLLPNRLVYPEHISNKSFFYQNADELFFKLTQFLQEKSSEHKNASSEIEKYRLEKLMPKYDSIVSELIETHSEDLSKDFGNL